MGDGYLVIMQHGAHAAKKLGIDELSSSLPLKLGLLVTVQYGEENSCENNVEPVSTHRNFQTQYAYTSNTLYHLDEM